MTDVLYTDPEDADRALSVEALNQLIDEALDERESCILRLRFGTCEPMQVRVRAVGILTLDD